MSQGSLYLRPVQHYTYWFLFIVHVTKIVAPDLVLYLFDPFGILGWTMKRKKDSLMQLERKRYVEKVNRPTLSAAGSSEGWAYFRYRWSDYVSATKITGRDKVIQLLECCDEPLRKDLTRSAGVSLPDKTVDEVLAAIKKLSVREENTMVARVTLHNMRQDRDVTVRSYGARLKGQAGRCKFVARMYNRRQLY
ncbi:uncharacterized protein LOC110447423 [Mizuhopecten yessoensis]|uniref:uncharacterized protein LOC110447423 n=1 Tax=Mizuhopecten yessoensis TaxID=6573 RepID=UPI000B45F0CA|nr:uncharacterized protein LOC110447423 [Mizuhopecten yessoensis]